jgi:hypothetical protein
VEWLYELDYDELIDYVIELWNDISNLERDLEKTQSELSDKIKKDFEDNKKMVSKVFAEFVNKNKNKNNKVPQTNIFEFIEEKESR